jgi:CubicO group peptidase (beta-lactamase class C family)
VAERLEPLNPQINELLAMAGTAGLSLGVYRNNESSYYANFSYGDIQAKLPVTVRIVFAGCSLTKLFTALSIALLVDDESNDVTSNTRIKDVLPDSSPPISTSANTVCFL